MSNGSNFFHSHFTYLLTSRIWACIAMWQVGSSAGIGYLVSFSPIHLLTYLDAVKLAYG